MCVVTILRSQRHSCSNVWDPNSLPAARMRTVGFPAELRPNNSDVHPERHHQSTSSRGSLLEEFTKNMNMLDNVFFYDSLLTLYSSIDGRLLSDSGFLTSHRFQTYLLRLLPDYFSDSSFQNMYCIVPIFVCYIFSDSLLLRL